MNFPMKLFTVDGKRPAAGKLRLRLWLVQAAVWLLVGGIFGQNASELFPEKPDPAVFVHDYSGWLSAQEKFILEDRLQRYRDSTSTEIVVMIRPDIGDYDRSSYAFELGNRWGIGRKSKNNGVVLLIVTEQPNRGAFIATGYGTEGALPDITAGRIIRNTMIPYFRQEQNFQGIDAGLTDIMRALAGEFKADKSDRKAPPAWIFLILALSLLVIIVVVAYVVFKQSKVYTGAGKSRRNRDDDWWGGGGFGGWGGGSFGGGGWGGASSGGGGWGGGGFGGGSFGGGGAGGSW